MDTLPLLSLLSLTFLQVFLPSTSAFIFSTFSPSSLGSISFPISTKQIYSFNFPRNLHPFQVCTTSSVDSWFRSRVTLINSHPLPGMTNFLGAVTEKCDAPFVPPSGSYDRLANQSLAALNLPNFWQNKRLFSLANRHSPAAWLAEIIPKCLVHIITSNWQIVGSA